MGAGVCSIPLGDTVTVYVSSDSSAQAGRFIVDVLKWREEKSGEEKSMSGGGDEGKSSEVFCYLHFTINNTHTATMQPF